MAEHKNSDGFFSLWDGNTWFRRFLKENLESDTDGTQRKNGNKFPKTFSVEDEKIIQFLLEGDGTEKRILNLQTKKTY